MLIRPPPQTGRRPGTAGDRHVKGGDFSFTVRCRRPGGVRCRRPGRVRHAACCRCYRGVAGGQQSLAERPMGTRQRRGDMMGLMATTTSRGDKKGPRTTRPGPPTGAPIRCLVRRVMAAAAASFSPLSFPFFVTTTAPQRSICLSLQSSGRFAN